MNPGAMTIISLRKECWPSRGSNQRTPVLKPAMLPTELWGFALEIVVSQFSKHCKFKHIYFTSIEKQVLTTYTNLSRFCFLGTTPALAPNVWANEKSQSWDSLPGLELGTSWLQGRCSTSRPRTPHSKHCSKCYKKKKTSVVLWISYFHILIKRLLVRFDFKFLLNLSMIIPKSMIKLKKV